MAITIPAQARDASFDGTVSEPSGTTLTLTRAEGSLAAGSITFELPS